MQPLLAAQRTPAAAALIVLVPREVVPCCRVGFIHKPCRPILGALCDIAKGFQSSLLAPSTTLVENPQERLGVHPLKSFFS